MQRVTLGSSCNESQKGNPVANVLIVDDDQQSIRILLEILARKNIRGIVTSDRKAAANLLDRNDYNLVLGVIQPDSPKEGFKLVHEVKKNSPDLPVIMMYEFQEQKGQNCQQILDITVKAINAGCCNFLSKPLNREKFENLLDTFLPNRVVSTADCAREGAQSLYRIVGKSAKLVRVVNLAQKIAPTSAPVLISGESGTGKELISFLIHHRSRRSQGAYIRVNCAALSDSLLESELFGHEKGAFTGAYSQRKGRFEMAHGGTLLLDEITETPPRFQAKLLRILEQQDFERVGGNDSIRVDVRIISTTNKDLLQEVAEGRFRQDLYYRLSGVRLIIPPLRQRSEDLLDLVWHFVNFDARQAQRRITKLDPAMMNIFAEYHWPGNIRQLRNVVLTSLILGTGPVLSLADVSWLFDELQPLTQENHLSISNGRTPASGLAGLPLAQVERQTILDTLMSTSGNQTKAAKILGISDRTLREKIRRYRQQECLQPA
ncbi:MAG: sigma-54-dependent transcriptional regulator [Planctomycetota bacterium]